MMPWQVLVLLVFLVFGSLLIAQAQEELICHSTIQIMVDDSFTFHPDKTDESPTD